MRRSDAPDCECPASLSIFFNKHAPLCRASHGHLLYIVLWNHTTVGGGDTYYYLGNNNLVTGKESPQRDIGPVWDSFCVAFIENHPLPEPNGEIPNTIISGTISRNALFLLRRGIDPDP